MQGIYFIDFETVPTSQEFPEGTPTGDFFKKRFSHEFGGQPVKSVTEQAWQQMWEKYASFHAEYCKIISASVGVLTNTKNNPQPMFYVKTFTHRNDEKWILESLGVALIEAKTLCGHNIIEFDIPVGMRRYLANGMPVPQILDCMNQPSYKLPYLDTMKMYSGSAWNYKISQAQLASILGVQSSKEQLDGSKIANLYWSDGMEPDMELAEQDMQNAMKLIGQYNAADVVCNARIYAKMRGFKDIKDEDIFYITT